MKGNKSKAAKKNQNSRVVCGTLDNIEEACRELDADMKVVWTSAGFWAVPVNESKKRASEKKK